MTTVIFFLLGLIIGSFLNVVVYRIRMAEDIFFDRSRCPNCKETIAWYDNIPVLSFILLKFRCRNCQEKISWQYPLVEIFTGIVFASITTKFFLLSDPTTWTAAFLWLIIASFLIMIFVYDFLYLEIPGLILWPGVGIAVVSNLLSDWYHLGNIYQPLDLATYSGTLAAILSFMSFFLLVAISKEKWMGMGDAYLTILLGLVLGWPKILLGLFLAFAIGAVYGIILIALKKKNMKSQVPFAPFLIAGAFIALFFYAPVTAWYWQLFLF